ncbi:MAG: hydrolase [Candidatus Latescibacteria bacterium]|nr:hydrolase [Candidatus Latescibacterota bacterium]
MTRHDNLLRRSDAALLIVDVQEKLAETIGECDQLVGTICDLIVVARRLNLPILLTEQYPKGLGRTVPELVDALGEVYRPLEKITFSCCGDERVREAIRSIEKRQVVVAGIEAHICVLQTTLDLLADGYHVHVPADAVASRYRTNREVSLARMQMAGATVTCKESIIFELLGQAGTPEFKEILPLLK